MITATASSSTSCPDTTVGGSGRRSAALLCSQRATAELALPGGGTGRVPLSGVERAPHQTLDEDIDEDSAAPWLFSSASSLRSRPL